ncbi:MAG TPA: response regulator [Terriglobales bacterium]|nr:response regulator [Terriglobales bacterium]
MAQTIRVLFVDDEPSIRMMLPPVLQQNGFEVRVAASVAEALVEINACNFDVLISDLNIERQGDGFLVVSAMRHLQPDCVNLILTGYPALETALQAIHDQVDDYLVKPAEIELLIKTIREKLESRKLQQPAARKKLSVLLQENAAQIQRQILTSMKQDPGLRSGFKDEAQANKLATLLTGLFDHLNGQDEALNEQLLNSATEHGHIRKKQGYTVSMLCRDFQLIQEAVYELIRKNLHTMSPAGLIADLETFHVTLNSVMAKSIQVYESKTKQSVA